MGPTSFIMILLGCTSSGDRCTTISTLPVAYRSEAGCLAARADIVAASSGLGYDRVIANCRRQGPARPDKLDARANTA